MRIEKTDFKDTQRNTAYDRDMTPIADDIPFKTKYYIYLDQTFPTWMLLQANMHCMQKWIIKLNTTWCEGCNLLTIFIGPGKRT